MIISHLHLPARKLAEEIASRLSETVGPDLAVSIANADAKHGRESVRGVSVKLYAFKGHGYPRAVPSAALDAVLDAVEGWPVKGFGRISSGHLETFHPVREGVSLSLWLEVETDPECLPDERFALDDRGPAPVRLAA